MKMKNKNTWYNPEDPSGVYLYVFALNSREEIVIKKVNNLDGVAFKVSLLKVLTGMETVCLNTTFTSFNTALYGANRYLATQGIISCSK